MEPEIKNYAIHREHFSGHIRRAGINPNCWYMIAKSSEIQQRPVKREIWNQPVVLFRTGQGELHGLEDRCAHRLVRLSHGQVIDDKIECAYHGWQFNGTGRCVHIPHHSQLSKNTVSSGSSPATQRRALPYRLWQ